MLINILALSLQACVGKRSGKEELGSQVAAVRSVLRCDADRVGEHSGGIG